jgi:hypothetical protein
MMNNSICEFYLPLKSCPTLVMDWVFAKIFVRIILCVCMIGISSQKNNQMSQIDPAPINLPDPGWMMGAH